MLGNPVRPYPVTATAVGNCLGPSAREVEAKLREGVSGLAPCRWQLPFQTFAGEFAGELSALPSSLASYDSRQARISLAVLSPMRPALDRARSRWGAERVALVIGTSTGGILETENAFASHLAGSGIPKSYDFERQHAFGAILELLRLDTGLRGPGYVVSTACSSSGKVLGAARRLLDLGAADAVLVGGVDSLCQTTLRGFHSLEVLSATRTKPFSSERNGINIGEGAAFLLLEREGDGPARLLGVGESSDAHHMSHPHPEGLGARAAMEQALAQAGLLPADIDHVNAHGTGTVLNDAAESKAIGSLLGDKVPTVSTKGFTGHMLGAAGATEAVFAVMALEKGFIPASLGADPLDPTLGIQINLERRDLKCRAVLSNSLAFGGSNVSVLLGATR